jgi:hypothetical protein
LKQRNGLPERHLASGNRQWAMGIFIMLKRLLVRLLSEDYAAGRYLRRLFIANRDFILKEVLAGKGIMQLLMKHRDTGETWTRSELRQIRLHFLSISLIVPALIVFLLPFGALILPVLAEVLDRRIKMR